MKELINLLHSGDENKIITVKMYDIAVYILSGLSIKPDRFDVINRYSSIVCKLAITWGFDNYDIRIVIANNDNIILGQKGWYNLSNINDAIIKEFDDILIASKVNGNAVI